MEKTKIAVSKFFGFTIQCLAFIFMVPGMIFLGIGTIMSDIGDTLRMID